VALAESVTKDARLRIRQVWIYAALIVVIIGGLVAALARDWRLFVPIGCRSVLVGFVGTVMALLEDRRQDRRRSENDDYSG
jgi:hypothetical protein